MADALKAEANKLFTAGQYDEAAVKYGEAIELDPSNHVLYSNRAATFASLKRWDQSLADATRSTELKPDFTKGWSRKGAALHGSGDLVGATEAYEKALSLDSSNAQAQKGLDSVRRAIEAEARAEGIDPSGGLGNMFNDPKLIEKLAANPKTAGFLSDSQFMAKIQNMKNNPQALNQDMFSDPRFLQVMGVLLGVDMQMNPTDDADAAAKKFKDDHEEDVPMTDARPSSTARKPEPKKEPEPEPEPEDEEAVAAKKAKQDADKEKALGTEAYKKRQFDEAISHYTKAWEIHKDILYLTNLGAAHFEKGDYAACVEDCKRAVEHGREVFADFKIVAKAFGRMGSAYEKQGDLANAVENYNKSLMEHRTPDILAKLRAAEKAKKTADVNAYIDPEKAEEARELGNQKFKESDWPAAVEAYSEMVKRAPEDPRGYSNRAACLIKLLTFPSAVQDCDEAIKRDVKFVRAYLRKAQALFAMKEFNKCIDVCAEAAAQDTDGKNAREISQQEQKALEAQYAAREGETEDQAQKRIQNDPEIMAILQDPVMSSILQQAKNDPAALQDHMRNPGIRSNIQKLMAAGVIRLGR